MAPRRSFVRRAAALRLALALLLAPAGGDAARLGAAHLGNADAGRLGAAHLGNADAGRLAASAGDSGNSGLALGGTALRGGAAAAPRLPSRAAPGLFGVLLGAQLSRIDPASGAATPVAEAARVLARNRWQLALTLLRNPQLAALRKHRLVREGRAAPFVQPRRSLLRRPLLAGRKALYSAGPSSRARFWPAIGAAAGFEKA